LPENKTAAPSGYKQTPLLPSNQPVYSTTWPAGSTDYPNGEASAACDQALEIGETLAARLDAEEMKTSFLNLALVREMRERRGSL
jgi:hypothetical protein